MKTTGQLYLIQLPSRNPKDNTFRAIDTLKMADYIVGDNTLELLRFYQINEQKLLGNVKNKELLSYLEDGKKVAVILGRNSVNNFSKLAQDNGFSYEFIPSASLLLSALVLSGFPTWNFLVTSAEKLKEYKDEKRTLVLQTDELKDTLDNILAVFGDRKTFVAIDLTRETQQTFRTSAKKLIEITKNQELKGEIIIVLSGEEKPHI